MKKRILASLLALVMVLSMVPAALAAEGFTQADEPQQDEAVCICDALCTEETVNADCPVCGGEAGYVGCTYMDKEIETSSAAEEELCSDEMQPIQGKEGLEVDIALRAGSKIKLTTRPDGGNADPANVTELFQGEEIEYDGWQLMKLVVTIPAQTGLDVTGVIPETPSLYPDLSVLKKENDSFVYTYYFKGNDTYTFDISYTLNGVSGAEKAEYTVDDLLELPDITMRAYFLQSCDPNQYRGYTTKTDLREGRYYTNPPPAGTDEVPYITEHWLVGNAGGPDGFLSYVKNLEGIQYVESLYQLNFHEHSYYKKDPIDVESLEPLTRGYYPEVHEFRVTNIDDPNTVLKPTAYDSEMLGKIIERMPNLSSFYAIATGFHHMESFGKMLDKTTGANGNNLSYLKVPQNGITSLHGLENHTGLTNIVINKNKISDLTPLKDIEKANFWNFLQNNIFDLTPISNVQAKNGELGFCYQNVYPEPVLVSDKGENYELELPMPTDIDGSLTEVGFANFLISAGLKVPVDQRDKLLVKYAEDNMKLYPTVEREGRSFVYIPKTDVPNADTDRAFEGSVMRFWFENDNGSDNRTRGYFNGNVDFTATTVEKPITCTVSYEFRAEDDTLTLPEEVLIQLPEAQVVNLGETVTIPEDLKFNPVKTDEGTWNFVGWDKTKIENISADDCFVGIWKRVKNAYTITYTDGVADEEVFADQIYTVDEGAATPAFNGTPSRAGYTFEGWSPAVAETVTSDATYAAQWKAMPEYTVSYDLNGGTGKDGVSYEPVTVQTGTIITVKDAPTKRGYTFEGWKLEDKTYEPGDSLAVTGDLLFVAQWHKKSSGGGSSSEDRYYILSYESNGGTEYKDERYKKNTVVELDKLPAREGYTFTGWYADEELTDRITSIKMTSDKTVYAGWESTGVPAWLNGDDHFSYAVGYSDGTVRPLNQISRAEVATIFFRLLNEDIREDNLTSVNTFADVNEGMWCNMAISTMAKLGVVKGRTPERFDPNAPITRAEFAAICARFDTSKRDGDSNFTDISGHWAEAEIERAASLSWIMGYTDGTFRPENYITRAEAMTMINRVLNRLPEDEDDLLDGMNVWPDNKPGDWYYLAVQEATNSHDFTRKGDVYQRWTKLNADPDWSQYQ